MANELYQLSHLALVPVRISDCLPDSPIVKFPIALSAWA